MFKFITHRPLWLNIIIGILLAIGIFAIFLLSLDWVTGHGKSATVPSVTGKKYDVGKEQLLKSGFDVELEDSVYVDSLPPMTIIRQSPEADELVKSNRIVFLVVNRAEPPIIEMPNLMGYSYRNAEMILKNIGLKIGDTTSKPDFAKNAILEQIYQGSQIAPGTKIKKGSTISLVLGDGVGKREFAVPVITGMQFGKAKDVLEANGIVVGAIVADGNVLDTASAWIYKQNPERLDEDKHIQHIRSGQTIDVWLQVDKPVNDSSKTSVNLPE